MRRALVLAGVCAILASCAGLGRGTGVRPAPRVAVEISAALEWRPVRAHFAAAPVEHGPYGEYFVAPLAGEPVLFFHGGYGKVSAAGATQWALQTFHPALLVNLGTCGGFPGAVGEGEVVLVEKTVIYDVVELMGDAAETIADFTTTLPRVWPQALRAKVHPGVMLSGDRDLDPAAVPGLAARFGGLAGDWESGSIAYVAARAGVPALLLRVVTDVVRPEGSPLYGAEGAFEAAAARRMDELLRLFEVALPGLREGAPAPP